MKKIRAAVIGCGAIAHHCHIPGYKKNKNSELVALVDPSKKNLEAAQAKFGVDKGYKSIEDLFENEDINTVSICSPNTYHAANTIYALEHGCNVLCEKPLCLNLKEATAVQRAAQKAGTIFMTAFTHRFFKGNQKAKQLIEKGKLGEPYMIRMRFAHEGPTAGWAMSDWFYKPAEAGGGAMFDMGIHAIDLMAFYMGPIKRLNAMMGTLEKKIALEDNALLQFEFESGKLGYAEVGWTSKQGFVGIEIYGTEAALVIDFADGVHLLTGKTSPSGKRSVRKQLVEKEPGAGGWDVEVDYFINCIRKGVQPEMGIEAGVQALKVALAAYDSAKKGKTVAIK